MILNTQESTNLNINNADNLFFDNKELTDLGLAVINPNLNIGQPTREQIVNLTNIDSIGSVLRTLISGALIPVGGVYSTTVSGDPGGINFIEDIEVSGTTTDDFVTLYGVDIAIDLGVNDSDAILIIVSALNNSGKFLSVANPSGNTIRITYKDRYIHEVAATSSNGLSFTPTVYQQSSDSTLGYGTWSLLGDTTIGSTVVYSYERVA